MIKSVWLLHTVGVSRCGVKGWISVLRWGMVSDSYMQGTRPGLVSLHSRASFLLTDKSQAIMTLFKCDSNICEKAELSFCIVWHSVCVCVCVCECVCVCVCECVCVCDVSKFPGDHTGSALAPVQRVCKRCGERWLFLPVDLFLWKRITVCQQLAVGPCISKFVS